ncbi:protein tramtrack, alpha isoform-like isoform X6 [Euwallacea similis]|uniref:protein tramtrack, alpha isoform-like isoform X6 n=1 Tax=Euwallacea similis TaxID=1736056 RepID=UPI00344CC39A
MASEQFSLCWDNFHKNMSSGMNSLLESGDLVDVTLAVEGKFLKAHKMVLSVCSPYFKELFKTNPCQHPIVFMKDVSYVAISDLLQFMYQGEVQVSQDNLTTFIKTAEALQIKGLTGDGNGSTDADSEPVQEKPTRHIDESYKPSPRPKKQLPAPVVTTTPAVKRPRLSASSNDSQSAPIAIAKTEPSSTGVDSSSVQFKVEPYDLNQSVTIPDDGDDNFDENLDDNTVDDTEDYSMMEGEEPQAGTSTDGTGEGQELSFKEFKAESPNFLEESPQGSSKTAECYHRVYDKFIEWCYENNFGDYTESTLLAFFKDRASRPGFKANSLWSYYSMLKTKLLSVHNINILEFKKLRRYLKEENEGWHRKMSPGLSEEQFLRFIHEAPDEKYLAVKVIFIIGVYGQCKRDELNNLKVQDVEDSGGILYVKFKDSNQKKSRTCTISEARFLEICRKYICLRPAGMNNSRFFIRYADGKCFRSPMGIHKIGGVPREVARYLNLPNWEAFTGHCFKRVSLYVTGK